MPVVLAVRYNGLEAMVALLLLVQVPVVPVGTLLSSEAPQVRLLRLLRLVPQVLFLSFSAPRLLVTAQTSVPQAAHSRSPLEQEEQVARLPQAEMPR